MRKFLSAILIVFFHQSISQNLTGKIIDRQKQPIVGAYVLITNNDHHSHTNSLGLFELDKAEIGDTIIVSHIGFKTKRLIVEKTSSQMIIWLDEQIIELSNVTILPTLDAINLFSKVDLGITPVNSSQELLLKVPGLIIGQHAGGGKAEQIFLRGFDIDHGTDIDITVDGIPVNMVSHAHGQGYADLHFVIPETVDKIDFGKGPYYSDHGNFATAGYVAFNTKNRLDNSSIKLEYGSFNTRKIRSMFSLLNTDTESAYIATEYSINDGPFESSQNFGRINLMGKFTKRLQSEDEISILISHFMSQWDASGQIPTRLVEDGSISRFGAIDDTEGGATNRTNLKFDYIKNIDTKTYIKNSIYLSSYDFELYSNFTFFLEDPVNGDQIRQKEDRQIFGINSEWGSFLELGRTSGLIRIGAGLRNDHVKDVELSRTVRRQTITKSLKLGDTDETNFFGFINGEFEMGKLVVNPALRIDAFNFAYYDKLAPQYKTLTAQRVIASPKLNVLYNQSENMQFYLKSGLGFHSNDTRVVVAKSGQQILPAAKGADLGIIWKPFSKLLVNAALWILQLDQEFVYVGDVGIVEPSGMTIRKGVDIGLRYEVFSHLFLYTDLNYAHARSIADPEGANYIPLAPYFTATGGLNVINYENFGGGIKFRMIADRPANQDYSIVARGYAIIDWNINYNLEKFNIAMSISNLLNKEWNETQFATTSRLDDEKIPVDEIHFTPGAPISFKVGITYKF
jgi:outer membrane receptor protein involved in Fe transport